MDSLPNTPIHAPKADVVPFLLFHATAETGSLFPFSAYAIRGQLALIFAFILAIVSLLLNLG